jgi:PucR C-terminal helix-turn-helix domain
VLSERDDGLVKDLEVRLAALDPDAGAAIRAIGYFDRLTEAGAGLEAIVRGAAVLTDCPARLADQERRLSVRVEPDGSHSPPAGPPARSWLNADAGPGAVLWLERPGPAGPVEAVVLERAAAAARSVLARTRGRTPSRLADEAAAEVLIDATTPPDARQHAALALGLTEATLVRAVALADGNRIEPAIRAESPASTDPVASDGRRAGIGTAGSIDALPASWAAARTALRLTAEGTNDDPGSRSVRYDELGALALLADSVSPATPAIPDELALEHAAIAAPWMLPTLHAVATSASLRAAAAALLVHHSTLQERIAHAERLLGWPVREPHGRHRLYLALALRRLRRHP